jgi:hypothetical protein
MGTPFGIKGTEIMASPKYDRRGFLVRASVYGVAGVAAVGSLASLAGCGGEETAEKAAETVTTGKNTIEEAKNIADPCGDVSGLSEQDILTRTTFKYEEVASDKAKLCNTCNFWVPEEEGQVCGGCTLVKGPIAALGSCISWVAKIES